MNRRQSRKNVELLLLYLAVTTFIILVVAFFGSYSISNEILKTFIQNITANIASTVFVFIVIYIFIKSQDLLPSVGDQKNDLTEEIRSIVNKEFQELEKFQEEIKSQIVKIDQKIDDLSQTTQQGTEQVSDRIIQTIQEVKQKTIESFTQSQKEAIQLFSPLLNYKLSRLDKLGFILNTYPLSEDREFSKEVKDLVARAKKITLIGTSLNLIEQENIIDLLIQQANQNRQSSITICLANPSSSHIEDRLTEEGMSGGLPAPVGHEKIRGSISNLMRKLENAGYPSNFEVLLFENYPTLATLIFDKDIFIYPYTYKTLGNYSPIFHLKDDESEETKFFLSNANKIIDDAIPVRDFVRTCRDRKYYSEKWIAAAVYLIPEKNQPFYKFGSAILGYDIWEQKALEDKRIVKPDYVGEAANFGFHATIGDALYFVNEAEIDRIKAELKMLAEKIPPFTLQELKIVDRYDKEGDIVIHCEDKTGVSEAIHSELIHCFYRSAISSTYRAEQTEKLSMVKNSERAKFMINKYGSPYILREFNLHFTLCTSPPRDSSARSELVSELKKKFDDEVSSYQVEINKIHLLLKRKDDERWKIEGTYTLRGR